MTHFVEKGAFKPALYLQDPKVSEEQADRIVAASAEKAKDLRESHGRKVYASVVSRVTPRAGRQLVKPEELLARAGLVPSDPKALAQIEEKRLKYLELVEKGGAWDGLHGVFFDNTDLALGRYTDLLTR